MPNKECRITEPKMVSSPVQYGNTKTTGVGGKVPVSKVVKDAVMSPTAPATEDPERAELLGSLTTQQQQRTSARVIKKLRLEPLLDKDKRGKRPDGSDVTDLADCDTPSKIDDKELKFPTVKQRMPKALWSIDEKNLFFEALNEYGKDFDAITAYICAKMKKKGMADANLKTKTQVSHFYYRTWHKLSKHLHFDENVKKVAQELYALINYGELRKKLVSVNEKTCARLGEIVLGGSMMVRTRGRNVRVRTPMCRALRKLNQITERACGARVCSRAGVHLRARSSGAWARVQAAAHNPRAVLTAPLRTTLADFIRALQKRWAGSGSSRKKIKKALEAIDKEEMQKETEEYPEQPRATGGDDDEKEDLENHLNLETDRIIVQEQKLPKKPVLHVGPRANAQVHIPAVSPSEQLSSQKICFSSYLERMGSLRRDKDGSGAKIRTPKRQRKDSTTDKDKENEQKKIKIDDSEPVKLINIDETAIDGIELMASYKNNQDDEEKPSTEDEKELKSEETAEEEAEVIDKDMSEKEKDSFSEMEDDEKFNKSDTDNESDGREKRKQKFKNLKVKFRIRPKKRGGSVYTLVLEKDQEEAKSEEPSKEEESKPDIDVDMVVRQIRKGWSVYDAGELTIGDLYLMFGSRSKLELDYWWAEPTPPLPQPQPLPIKPHKSETTPPDKDKPIEKKEKTDKTPDKDSTVEEGDKRESDTDIFSPKAAFGQDSNDGLSGDERKNEQLASPDHKSSSTSCSGTLKLVSKLINRPVSQPPNNSGFSLLSDRLKRLLALVGNAQVAGAAGPGAGSCAGPGQAPGAGAGAGGAGSRCVCGHVCAPRRPHPACAGAAQQKPLSTPPPVIPAEEPSAVFRHPTPIAPRPGTEAYPQTQKAINLEGLPRWRRGRPRAADRRVVVQRLLPLLPKLPPPNNLIPVKIVPNTPPQPPRILPKPPPTSTSDLSFFYVLSESNGQFFFHDGDRRIPISPLPTTNTGDVQAREEEETEEVEEEEIKDIKVDISATEMAFPKQPPEETATSEPPGVKKTESDIANFLPSSESLSLSPSRLLRDADGWLEGSVHDFSLSSFLGHLEGRPQPDLAVDSHLHSLMAESSVDYVAKFADLAAEVTDEVHPLQPDELH